MFDFKTCDMCGKQYIPRPGSIYKINFASKKYNFCCYSCHKKAKQCKETVQANQSEAFYVKLRKELQENK